MVEVKQREMAKVNPGYFRDILWRIADGRTVEFRRIFGELGLPAAHWSGRCDEEESNSCGKQLRFLHTHLPWMISVFSFFMSRFSVFFGSSDLKVRGLVHAILVILKTVLWPFLMSHLSRVTGGIHRRGLVCIWVKRTSDGAQALVS